MILHKEVSRQIEVYKVTKKEGTDVYIVQPTLEFPTLHPAEDDIIALDIDSKGKYMMTCSTISTVCAVAPFHHGAMDITRNSLVKKPSWLGYGLGTLHDVCPGAFSALRSGSIGGVSGMVDNTLIPRAYLTTSSNAQHADNANTAITSVTPEFAVNASIRTT